MKSIKRLIACFLTVIMIAGMTPIQSEAASVKLNKTKLTVYAGSSAVLKLQGASKKITWNSTNRTVASVNNKGRVTAKKAGKTVITAKYDKKTYQCKVTVKKPYLNSVKKTLYKGKTYTLKLTGTKPVSWHTSDKRIAAVTQKGKVTAKKAGTAVVTCKGKDGKSYQCRITVKNKTESGLTEEKVYQSILAMKSKYPEGMSWTNDHFYSWKGGIYSGGYGCAGFAFLLSDAVFGDLPARKETDFSRLRAGDIIRMNYDTHSVIVLEVKSTGVVVAEGNFNSSIHWGREISNTEIKTTGTYVLTRYPQ